MCLQCESKMFVIYFKLFSEWSASRPSRFVSREWGPINRWREDWIGPRAVLQTSRNRSRPALVLSSYLTQYIDMLQWHFLLDSLIIIYHSTGFVKRDAHETRRLSVQQSQSVCQADRKTVTPHSGQWHITKITRDRQVRGDRQVSNINACKPHDAVSSRICNCDGQ